jgi:HAD superfamily phosphatase
MPGQSANAGTPMKDLIVFDMDGVLVDVSESYRAAIQATVLHFTGHEPTNDEVQTWKNKGGYNDDWKLSHHMIQERGKAVPFEDVVERFQKLFLGENNNGLILRERWLASEGLFDRLAENHTLAIFTGRFGWEAQLTLDRFAKTTFSPVIGLDHVENPKPHPEGLRKARAAVQHRKIWYLGDTVDDARSARGAEVPFIGVASPKAPRHVELVELLRKEGAIAVIDDINSLEAVLATHR